MNNRFCRMGKSLLGAVCLLSTCGVTYSCSDDYDLPDTKPSFLGQSIYDELKNRSNFTTVIRLIDDLGQKDVLAKTGSKTLFVADDAAYAKFFASNNWKDGAGNPIDSYEKLSTNQKRLLFNGSMINNAYVLEKLTTIQGPVKNLCLRQIAASTATDSIPYWRWDELPDNQNKGQLDDNGKVTNADMRFWDRYRKQSRGGIYMALDGTDPMMTHFLEAQLNEKNIKHSDVSFILNLDGTSKEWTDADSQNRSYVYNSQITEQDVTCLNGYFNVLDTVLVAPSNMAEVIRTNGDTKYFSAMLDRFSAPYYDRTLTQEYKALNDIAADSVFKKIYIAQRSSYGTSLTQGPNKESLDGFPRLAYDPGWNQYTINQSTKEQDMAAMFVPCDEAMVSYFVHGGGMVLIERYGDQENTEANLMHNLYQIPLNIVQPLIKNLMKESFNESVPSKYLTIMNDAQDPMFDAAQYPSVSDYKAAFKKVLLANNGVVYVMKNVISPATYASVMAPVLYDRTTQVVNTVLHADDDFTTTNYTKAPLRKFYSTYLLAMQSSFSFFVPVDAGLANYGYIDPVSLANTGTKARYAYWTFIPSSVTSSNSDKHLAIRATGYPYSPDLPLSPSTDKPKSGYQSLANESLEQGWAQTKKFLLCEMIDHHIIVHDNDDSQGVRGSRNYYLSRNGAPVFIKKRGNSAGIGMEVEGGMQIDLNNDDNPNNNIEPTVTKSYDMTRATNQYGNGMTYYIDRPMQATTNTVYGVMENQPQFSKFFELCKDLSSSAGTSLLRSLFYVDSVHTSEDKWITERNKYYIFADNASSSSNPGARLTATQKKLVRFFNAYRYSVYVPDNDAITEAESNGLPTVQSIQEYVTAHTSEVDGSEVIDPTAKLKAQAMVTTLVNFLRYHFADQSLFVDNCTDNTSCQSACADDNGGFIKLTNHQTPNAMSVTDQAGDTYNIVAPYNLCARDFELNAAATTARSITNSSYVALHSLGNHYLLFDASLKGENGFKKAWETAAKAKSFIKKYRIKK